MTPFSVITLKSEVERLTPYDSTRTGRIQATRVSPGRRGAGHSSTTKAAAPSHEEVFQNRSRMSSFEVDPFFDVALDPILVWAVCPCPKPPILSSRDMGLFLSGLTRSLSEFGNVLRARNQPEFHSQIPY